MTHPISDEALNDHVAILGKTGSGKSNAAKTVVEILLERGERVCVLDPTGTWWGLRLWPNGKPSRFKPVIFGGQHADVPIDAPHGAAIADVVGTSSTPAIIDTRLMTVGARTRFFTGFAEALLRANQGVLHLVIDEAHLFAPQGKVNDPASGQMVHAANNLISLGRGIGLRIILISQRPAKLHKDSLSQAETLVAMRLILPHDRQAVGDWIKDSADAEQGREIMASLAGLPTGDAWVWSPQQGPPRREHFPLAATFDSGKAPAAGQGSAPALGPIDLQDVTGRLEQVGKDVLANDPKALKAEIARLKAEAAKAPAADDKMAARIMARAVEVADQQGFERGLEEGERRGKTVGIALGLTRARNALDALRVPEIAESEVKPAAAAPAAVQRQHIPAPEPRQSRPTPAPAPRASEGDVVLNGPQRRILDTIAWWTASGIAEPSAEQVAFVAGYSNPTGGGFANPRSALSAGALIEYPRPGRIRLTDAGAALTSPPEGMITTPVLHARVLDRLNGPQQRILQPLLDAYPEAIEASELATRAGYTNHTGGGFANPRSSLSSLSLIVYPSPGQVRAADWLFP